MGTLKNSERGVSILLFLNQTPCLLFHSIILFHSFFSEQPPPSRGDEGGVMGCRDEMEVYVWNGKMMEAKQWEKRAGCSGRSEMR